MKTDSTVFVVCRYDRWSSFWFKELVNYILVNESAQNVAEYNSRYKEVVLSRNKKLCSVRFMAESLFENTKDGRNDYSVVYWNDGPIEELYSKIKEAANE